MVLLHQCTMGNMSQADAKSWIWSVPGVSPRLMVPHSTLHGCCHLHDSRTRYSDSILGLYCGLMRTAAIRKVSQSMILQ
jgi:hypothetical protein